MACVAVQGFSLPMSPKRDAHSKKPTMTCTGSSEGGTSLLFWADPSEWDEGTCLDDDEPDDDPLEPRAVMLVLLVAQHV